MRTGIWQVCDWGRTLIENEVETVEPLPNSATPTQETTQSYFMSRHCVICNSFFPSCSYPNLHGFKWVKSHFKTFRTKSHLGPKSQGYKEFLSFCMVLSEMGITVWSRLWTQASLNGIFRTNGPISRLIYMSMDLVAHLGLKHPPV